MSELNASSKRKVSELEDLGSDIANNTRLSKKQAIALVGRKYLNWKDKHIADVLSVKPASASSYISTCRSKFDSVDEEISELEECIDEWERTDQLQDILLGCSGFDELRDQVESDIVKDEDVKYAVSYINGSGEEDLRLTEESPQNLEVEVIEYKRVSSVEELFG